MAREITRNIRDTKLRGEDHVEPLYTNEQNDLLSDEKDAFIRNNNEYHCLTDNIKVVKTESGDIVTIKNDGRKDNSATVTVKETEITGINGPDDLVKITAEKVEPNEFELTLDGNNLNSKLEEIEGKLVFKKDLIIYNNQVSIEKTGLGAKIKILDDIEYDINNDIDNVIITGLEVSNLGLTDNSLLFIYDLNDNEIMSFDSPESMVNITTLNNLSNKSVIHIKNLQLEEYVYPFLMNIKQ